jgi:hypothetical protein
MIKPEPQVIKGLAMATRQHPEILAWLKAVHAHELNRLPYTTANPTVFQGRCQMTNELIEFLEQVPSIAAKL